jgi:superfamily II DNA or RNA helicase
MEIFVSNKTSFTASELPPAVLEQAMKLLTFPNPAYLEAVKQGRYTGNIPQYIRGYRFFDEQVIVPRGFTRELVAIIREAGIDFREYDQRQTLPEVDFTFTGQLRDFQEVAVREVMAHDFGVLESPTGSGKTVMALALVARRRQPALIIVHTKELLMQWVSRIESFLGIPASEIGIIGNGQWYGGERITVATVQSLLKGLRVAVPHIGFLIVDECHRCPSKTFTKAVTAFDCQYMLGLSATPWRRDGLDKIIWWNLGDLVFRVDQSALQDTGHVLRAQVVWRETEFESRFDASTEYPKMLRELTQDRHRNALILGDIVQEAKNGGGICLVLSDRKSHVREMALRLNQRGIETAMLTGDMGHRKRQAVVEALENGEIKVLIATAQLIGEGFDCPELSTLFLATPISFAGRLLQCLGRVLRAASGKDHATVYDYCDRKVGVLEHSASVRQRVYEEQFGILNSEENP